eukprot:CAMPEP_0117666420 /NCGR_PEP_ID=MMETSP0804-20121206/10367_1 /TAXON_ID=1074897 /ORGANISM="Tetraselmis astigmatica, Strain CCMP880" /LENGTH=116 /DNA_ID=CAMNT_0005473965 /DNA_START=407 /DNA_END=757 /DNA_ORIENTATION=+
MVHTLAAKSPGESVGTLMGCGGWTISELPGGWQADRPHEMVKGRGTRVHLFYSKDPTLLHRYDQHRRLGQQQEQLCTREEAISQRVVVYCVPSVHHLRIFELLNVLHTTGKRANMN